MRRFVCVVFVCGCGSVSETNHLDGGVSDGKGSDGQLDGAVPPACNLTAPFGTPTQVAGVNSNSSDAWGWFVPDGLTIYMMSIPTGANTTDIYSATRTQVSGGFTNVQPLAGPINSPNSNEERAVTTADSLTIFFESDISGTRHLYTASRANTAADFGTPAAVAGVNSNAADAQPWISADGLTLYLTSTRNGVDDIFRATRTTTSMAFGTPVAVGELNTMSAADRAPTLSADGLEIFFSSTRTSQFDDIWHATRSSQADGFGTPTKVAELSDDATQEFPTWLSPDRCTLVFTSNRGGGNGGLDIWMAKRPL